MKYRKSKIIKMKYNNGITSSMVISYNSYLVVIKLDEETTVNSNDGSGF